MTFVCKQCGAPYELNMIIDEPDTCGQTKASTGKTPCSCIRFQEDSKTNDDIAKKRLAALRQRIQELSASRSLRGQPCECLYLGRKEYGILKPVIEFHSTYETYKHMYIYVLQKETHINIA